MSCYCPIQSGRVLTAHAAFIYVRLIISVLSFVLCCFSPLNNLPGGRKPYPPERCQLVTVSMPMGADGNKCSGSGKKEDRDHPTPYKDFNSPALANPNELTKTKLRTPCPEEFASHASYLSYMYVQY